MRISGSAPASLRITWSRPTTISVVGSSALAVAERTRSSSSAISPSGSPARSRASSTSAPSRAAVIVTTPLSITYAHSAASPSRKMTSPAAARWRFNVSVTGTRQYRTITGSLIRAAILRPVTRARVLAAASVAAFAALMLALGFAGAVPAPELLWATASAAVAFLPTAIIAPAGWRRRAAELTLLPAAYAIALVADPTMRRVIVPPLLVLAALAAVAAAMRAVPAALAPHLAVVLVVAGRLAAGLGLTGEPLLKVLLAFAAPAVVAWVACRSGGRETGVLAALLVLSLPLQRAPLWAVVLTALAVLAAPSLRSLARVEQRAGWTIPAFAVALIGSACGAWGGLRPGMALPSAGLLAIAARPSRCSC